MPFSFPNTDCPSREVARSGVTSFSAHLILDLQCGEILVDAPIDYPVLVRRVDPYGLAQFRVESSPQPVPNRLWQRQELTLDGLLSANLEAAQWTMNLMKVIRSNRRLEWCA